MAKLYHVGLHYAPIKDLDEIFRKLGHQHDFESLSGHNWIMNLPKPSLPMLEQDRWCTDFVKSRKWNEWYDTYKDKLGQYDAFVITYPVMWSMLYTRFDKPVIVQAPIRYDYGILHLPEDWKYLNGFIRERVDAGKMVLTANNLHDKHYMELFVEREVMHIPSVCEYMPVNYNPAAQLYVMYLRGGWPGLPANIQPREGVFPDGYKWEQALAKIKGIVHFPYATSTMSAFEFYTRNFPMFIPSLTYCCEMYARNERSAAEPIFWHWCNTKLFNMLPASTIPYSNRAVPDPNQHKDIKSFEHWVKYSDFYDKNWMPSIQQFNSMQELAEMTTPGNSKYVDCAAVSKRMAEENQTRLPKIYELWKQALAKVGIK